MLKKYIFHLLLINLSVADNNLPISLSNNQLQLEFSKIKKFYEKLLQEYYKTFKTSTSDFIELRHRIKFIKKFYDNNFKVLDNLLFINMILPFIINEDYNQPHMVNEDWEKNLIKEIEFTNIKKLSDIKIEIFSSLFSINELLKTKKLTLEEANNFFELIREYEIEEKNKIINIKKTIEFKDLNEENYSTSEERILNLKNDEKTNSFIRNFISSGKFSNKEKQYINEHIWTAIEFLDIMYEEYFHYFNNRESNFNKEIEIIKKINFFKNKNNTFKNLSYLDVYFLIKDMFPFKIERINDKYYTFKINNLEKYSKLQILQLEDFQKLTIVFNAFYMLSFVLVKNNLNNSKLEEYFPVL